MADVWCSDDDFSEEPSMMESEESFDDMENGNPSPKVRGARCRRGARRCALPAGGRCETGD